MDMSCKMKIYKNDLHEVTHDKSDSSNKNYLIDEFTITITNYKANFSFFISYKY